MRRGRNMAWRVTVFAFCLRVVYCAVAVFVFHKGAPGGVSHDGYLEIARSLVAGDGYRLLGEPNFFRPPVYVLFLIPWVLLPGTPYWIMGAQAVLGAVTCGLVTRLARRFVSGRWAMLAGLTLAICPWHVHFTANAMTIILACFLTTALLVVWMEGAMRLSLGRSAGSGLLFGALALCHPASVGLGLAWIGERLWSARRTGLRRAALSNVAVFAASTAVVLAPWIIRNRLASGDWIILTNAGGFQYYVADRTIKHAGSPLALPPRDTTPGLSDAAEALREAGIEPSPTLKTFKGVGLAEARFFNAWARRDLLEHPDMIGRRLFQQGWWFWFGDRRARLPLHLGYKVPLLLLALVGAWRGFRRARPIGPLVLCVLAYWLIHALVMGYIPLAAYCLAPLGPVCVLAAIGAGGFRRADTS